MESICVKTQYGCVNKENKCPLLAERYKSSPYFNLKLEKNVIL